MLLKRFAVRRLGRRNSVKESPELGVPRNSLFLELAVNNSSANGTHLNSSSAPVFSHGGTASCFHGRVNADGSSIVAS
jgi:hypothetical protein